MEIYGYLASILMGLSLGMIGGGGSILTVPILVYLFSFDPLLATTYSLFIVGATALVGGIFYLRKGEVDLKTGVLFAIPSFIGVYTTRGQIVPRIPDPVFAMGTITASKPMLIMAAFAVLMVAASLSMIRARKPGDQREAQQEISPLKKTMFIGVKGLFVGSVTGFVGAGGGFLIVPALVVLVGLPMKRAIGTSLLIIAANSLIGFAGDLQRQASIHWELMLSVAAIAVSGLFVGMAFNKKVSEKTLKVGFGYFVLIMGTFIFLDQIKKL